MCNRICLIASLLICWWTVNAQLGHDGTFIFRAGAAQSDITPKIGSSINGSMQDRSVEHIHDETFARCIVLDDGNTELAMVVSDLCMVYRETVERAKQRAHEVTDIPIENMLMSATHTHSAGTACSVFQSDPDPEYLQFLSERMADAVIRAYNNLAPAKIGWGSGEEPSQVFNRRWKMKPGTDIPNPFGKMDMVKMNPGIGNPNLMEPAGPIDPEVAVVSIQDLHGKPIGLLANYSLHYVGGIRRGEISADYYGLFCNQIRDMIVEDEAGIPFVGIMSNGTSGDINNIDFAAREAIRLAPYVKMNQVANTLAAEVLKVYSRLDYHDWVPLDSRQKEIKLGVRKPTKEEVAEARERIPRTEGTSLKKLEDIYARETILLDDYPAEVPVILQAIRIGDLVIAAAPCEIFVEIGLEIKEKSPFGQTFSISLANGYNGYLPTPAHHKLGGYETWRARSSYLEVNASVEITRTLLDLLHDLHDKKYPGSPVPKLNDKVATLSLFNGQNLDGWYTFIKDRGTDSDPKNVFTVADGMIRISGEEYGCITTEEEYQNYMLEVEYKWGERTFAPRIDRARDNGVLIHSRGVDGGYSGTWMHSIECQIIEGGTGDFLVVGDGSDHFSITSTVASRDQGNAKFYDPNGQTVTINKGRINWYARDPNWKDELGFRGENDQENPVGEWNKLLCIAKGSEITLFLNGHLVNHTTDVVPTSGKIQIQSEGAEMLVRKVALTPLK